MKKMGLILFCFSLLFGLVPAMEGQNSQKQIKSEETTDLKTPSLKEVFNLINLNQSERLTLVTTANPDGSAHASVVGLRAFNNLLKFRASSKIAVARNLQRTQKALVIVYKIPEKGLPLVKHQGARVWVELVEDLKRTRTIKTGKNLKSIYSMKVVKIESLHPNTEKVKEGNK